MQCAILTSQLIRTLYDSRARLDVISGAYSFVDGKTSEAVGSSPIVLRNARPSPLIFYLSIEGSAWSSPRFLITPPTLGAYQGEIRGGIKLTKESGIGSSIPWGTARRRSPAHWTIGREEQGLLARRPCFGRRAIVGVSCQTLRLRWNGQSKASEGSYGTVLCLLHAAEENV